MYELKVARIRSFSWNEQKKIRHCALVGTLLLVALSMFPVFKSHLRVLTTTVNSQRQISSSTDVLVVKKPTVFSQPLGNSDIKAQKIKISKPGSGHCNVKGDIRVHGNSSTIFISSSSRTATLAGNNNNNSWEIRPYAWKGKRVMSSVKKWTVKLFASHEEDAPRCEKNHSFPAILFSLAGYSGNHFHDFSDLVIPLYSTSIEFGGQVHFLATNYKSWWISKFRVIIGRLSRHKILDIDRENHVHCYPGIILGLRSHRELGIDPSRSFNGMISIKNFIQFLRSTYSLERSNSQRKGDAGAGGKSPHRLMLISRGRSRKLLNEDEIVRMATDLGYDVVVADANHSTDISSFARTVNSCDVLVGVHGAGLTNMVFLPENAVVVQVIPLGGIEVFGRHYFGEPAADMNINCLEYKVGVRESSLLEKYSIDHAVLKDPKSIHKRGWDAISSIYLKNQNMRLDLGRFRKTLSQAMKLLDH